MAITLTVNAAERVKRFLNESGSTVGLRFGVKRTGCSGMAYVVDLARSIEPGDEVYESMGVKIVVDRESLSFVEGTEIDFSGEPMSESFRFSNPRQKTQCGCGESFGV
ncbi:MAG: iron-sulfur cluster assembly accessory protein [Gammaproteobacteria bacterium]|jgi:iron-sulfur cluster assembly protein